MIANLKLAYNDPTMELYISGEGNWRYDIYPEYKLNRKDVPKPQWLQECRERLVVQYSAEIVNGAEVDDRCGIRMTQLAEDGTVTDKVVCASLDKDLLQIPGYHYAWETRGATWVKPAREVLMSPLDSLRYFYKQVITGDQADHVPAFDGKFRSKTPIFVEKLLAPLDEMTKEVDMWNHVLSVYADVDIKDGMQGSPVNAAILNASVLYVQRREGGMWQVPGQTGG